MPQDFLALLQRCGKEKIHPKTVIRSLRDCLFMAGIYDDRGALVAFGRVCGDGAMYFLVCDLLVDPAYEDSDLFMKIYKEVDDFLMAVAPNDSKVLVMTDKEGEDALRKFGYRYLDRDYRTVMIRE